MHLAEEEVQRLLDGEQAATVTQATRDHLATCAECRSRVKTAEAEEAWVGERLRSLDHAPPKLSAREIIVRRRARVRGRIAAGFVLLVGLGGVAYAAPGSPLPGLLARLVEQIAPSHRSPGASPRTSSEEEPQAGIAVYPGEHFTVDIAPAASGGSAIVSLTESSEVVVRATGGSTTFGSEVDKLAVRHSGDSLTLRIEVPSKAPLVEVRSAGRSLWRKEGSRITAQVPADPQGRYRISLRR